MSVAAESIEKLLWRHAHAMGAMQSALAALESLEEAYASGAHHLIESLWTAYFVAYGRPFTANREIGQISTRHVPHEHRSTHRASIAARNAVFGHTDPAVKMDDAAFVNDVVLEVRGNTVVPIPRSLLPSAEELPRFGELAQSVHDSLGQEIANNLTQIPEVQSLLDGVYAIQYDAPAGNRLIPVEE
jgi:hypothetical protein